MSVCILLSQRRTAGYKGVNGLKNTGIVNAVKRAFAVCAAAALSCSYAQAAYTAYAETSSAEESYMTAENQSIKKVVIDGKTAATAENKRYRGLGMVSGNNTSRLLIDYKTENPERYEEILEYLFGEEGLGITHLKIEMGADVDSSSGTEPCVKRTEDEEADVTRGAGYVLAADAKKVNPDLTLDMLWWSEPRWITRSEDQNAARYKWYRETLVAAYNTYGIEFDYVSANRNERGLDTSWIKYLSKSLKADEDAPYDFSKIKVVAADEVTSWQISAEMLKDEELLEAVDVVGSHYTSWSDENTMKLMNEYGKEIWFSEASSPMSYSKGTYKYDGNGSGINDLNGILDIANRIITMYPGGGMTLYEFQPVVTSYYDGATYSHKQLITANEPWSGYYSLDNGFYMSLHFSQFFKKGWTFIESACAGDGVPGGDGHCIKDAVYSYMTAADPDTGDYSTVVTNTTSEPITYSFEVSDIAKAGESADIWETRGPGAGDEYDSNYYKKIDTVTPEEKDGAYVYSVTVKPYSMVTISTLKKEEKEYPVPDESERKILTLPYEDDFEYDGYADDYLSSRGNAPRYTTDEAGAFEVAEIDGNNVLRQVINQEDRSLEWGGLSKAASTNFGDDSWFNYSVSADVSLVKTEDPEKNFAGVGLRYNLADALFSGYWVKLYENGAWELCKCSATLKSGSIDGFDPAAWNSVKIEAVGNTVKAWINGELICEFDGYADESNRTSMVGAGRAALYSDFRNNMFDNIKIEPVQDADTNIVRLDNTDDEFEYEGQWQHSTMDSFKNYKRTVSTGTKDCVLTLNFVGKGFALTGLSGRNGAKISVEIDGNAAEESFEVPSTYNRECVYYLYGLDSGEHTARITVLDGDISVDSAEISDSFEIKRLNSAEDTADVKAAPNEGKKRSYALPIAAGAAAVVAGTVIAAAALKKKKKK